MPTTRTTTIAAALALSLACSATASAETDHSRHAELPASAKVINAPAKRVSLERGAKLRAKIRRTGKLPAGPKLKLSRRAIAQLERNGTAAPAPAPEAAGAERMFGSEGPYATKRDRILNAIQSFHSSSLHRFGGQYVSPALYEVQHGGGLPGCNAAVYNGVYCPGVNSIGWSMTWTNDAFSTSGDMKWATLIAHEYGHAAQRFLRISGGWMGYTLYSESFADCMAGAFLWNAHYYRMTDNVGRGDYNEFRDAFVSLASPYTDFQNYSNHGDFKWRYALATYGWNTGMQGCISWARSIDGDATSRSNATDRGYKGP